MPTLDALQELRDYGFHQLCDQLLRRVEPRYAGLTPHGINPEGKSVIGQPDSYVGDSAATCRIAFQYSVDEDDWWNKVIDDVREAVKASPSVEEIVVATPRDTDREGPKRRKTEWLEDARAAAGKAKLSLYGGVKIASYLDTNDLQDLRFEYLHIPFSRLTLQGIATSSRTTSRKTIEDLTSSGRYDPAHYLTRDADRELHKIWRRAFGARGGDSSQDEDIRLIAVANDSGLGKTSLLCTFAESLGAVLPVLMLAARDLELSDESSLIRCVIEKLQGVLEPQKRVHEEAALVRLLSGSSVLSVVVDGLDESGDPALVRKAISGWLNSRLGKSSILVVSSRPEFWRRCGDARVWARRMPNRLEDDRQPTDPDGRPAKFREPGTPLHLPKEFSEAELNRAWVRAGRTLPELYGLPNEVRDELRHPFTLRAYLELLESGKLSPSLRSRADILDAWLNRRLDAEVDLCEHLSRDLYREALCVVAARLNGAAAGWLIVDDLTEVPRFDPVHPPGPVVDRLIASNIVQTVPEHPDRIRFSFEAVHDYFLAENEVKRITANPAGVAETYRHLSLSQSYTRLAQVGRRLPNVACRNEFVALLADHDPAKAVVVLRADPQQYDGAVRSKVAEGLGGEVGSRVKAKGALAVELLGTLDCPESRAQLARILMPPSATPPI
jgi:hypothetical protein